MIIQNGTIYHKGKLIKKNILVSDDRIEEIGLQFDTDKNYESIDATGLVILPGLIDPHVHLRDPGATHKEDFRTGSRAAIKGGFTTVLDMPNNPGRPTISKGRLDEKIKLSKEKSICDVDFIFGTTNDNFDEIRKIDPLALKIYMGHTTGDLLIKDMKVVEKHFENFNKNKPIVLHAEDQLYAEETGDSGAESARRGVEKAVKLAKRTKRRIHITHAGSAEEINEAKKYDKCTIGISPHYLFLSEKNYPELKNRRFVKPHLRTEEDRLNLWKKLDEVNCVGSDHAPHTLAEKEKGVYGFPGLETSFHLFLNAHNKGKIPLKWIVERMSTNPAKIFGLENKGEIRTGNFADLTFVDMNKEWTLKEEELETKCKWSPFNGWKFKGKVVGVIQKGKTRMWDSQLLD